MSESEEFFKRLQELEEEISKDPKMKALREKMERELGTLSHEDLHHIIYRGSASSPSSIRSEKLE